MPGRSPRTTSDSSFTLSDATAQPYPNIFHNKQFTAPYFTTNNIPICTVVKNVNLFYLHVTVTSTINPNNLTFHNHTFSICDNRYRNFTFAPPPSAEKVGCFIVYLQLHMFRSLHSAEAVVQLRPLSHLACENNMQ